MILGYTGTRDGMNEAQKRRFATFLRENGVTELHHGDCVGGDEDAHHIARAHGVRVVIHPPVDAAHRAFCMGADYVHPPKTHFARNRHIVNATDGTLGTPKLMVETDKGGTWMTLRYAVKKSKPRFIIWPDGTLKADR